MCCCLLVEGCDDVEVLRVVCLDPTEVELHFGLRKPNVQLESPESLQLEGDCVFFHHKVTFPGIEVTTVATQDYTTLFSLNNSTTECM